MALDEDIQCLIKLRDDLKMAIQSSRQLNQTLKNRITSILTNERSNTNELSCFSDSRYNLPEDRNGTDNETRHYEVSLSHSGYSCRSLICKGCNTNFRLIKPSVVYLLHAYTNHCVKECADYKKLGKQAKPNIFKFNHCY